MTDKANGRALEAWKMRVAGKTFREIGEYLGVGITQASSLEARGRRMMHAYDTTSGIAPSQLDPRDLRIMALERRIKNLERDLLAARKDNGS